MADSLFGMSRCNLGYSASLKPRTSQVTKTSYQFVCEFALKEFINSIQLKLSACTVFLHFLSSYLPQITSLFIIQCHILTVPLCTHFPLTTSQYQSPALSLPSLYTFLHPFSFLILTPSRSLNPNSLACLTRSASSSQ